MVVAETTIGDVRGKEGFFHYRQYSAVELAEKRSLEDVWHLLFNGDLPDAAAATAFGAEVRRRRALPPGVRAVLPAICRHGAPLDVLRTAVSLLAAELGWRPTHDIEADELYDQASGSVRSSRRCSRRRIGCGKGTILLSPVTISGSPPIPLHADRRPSRAPSMPGPSSST